MVRLVKKFVTLCFMIVWAQFAGAQQMLERSALRSLEKNKWDKAERQIIKSFHKDSLNATTYYIYARYYFHLANPDFNVDSAYAHVTNALAMYARTEPREKERMLRVPLDSTILIALRERIDSAAFERAKNRNNEAAYLDFLKRFPYAAQREQARELRDEVAYLDALKENTYQAYAEYLEKYPDAHRARDARVRYDKLLFEAKTSDRRLNSYVNFLKEHSDTPYRRVVEQQIFEISTAGGDVASYVSFIRAYPRSPYAAFARDIAYHLERENRVPHDPFVMNDSLARVSEDATDYLVPVFKRGLFGFMNSRGDEVIAASAKAIPDEYKCGNIQEDVLALPDGIMTPRGERIFEGSVDSLDDLGYGFMLTTTGDCHQVLHKSGRLLFDDCVADARVVAGRFIVASQQGHQILYTLAGRRLQKEFWDDVQSMRGAVALKRNGQWLLATPDQLARAANLEVVDFKGPFSEVRATLSGIWVRRNDEEGLLDATLTELVPTARQNITERDFGAVITSAAGEQIYMKDDRLSPVFQKVKVADPWIAVKQASRWHLYDTAHLTAASAAYDTLAFYGPFAAGINADSATVYFNASRRLDFVNAQFEFVPGKSAAYFLLVTREKSKVLFDKSGNRLFEVDYESIQHLDQGFFLVSKKGRQGIERGVINLEGKAVVPMEYDAVGSYSDGKLPVLKNMKFGLTDLVNKKTIKPQYDKNIIPYNTTFVVAFRGGQYGFITWDNKPHTEFEFDEVKPWNDSTALVRKSGQWILFDIAHREVLMDRIRRFSVVRDDADEKVLIVIQDNAFGVISNRHGTVIPATFSDIINIGSAENPFYFTEKHVEEASLFVVIYYDAAGKYITRQTYELDDYDRIYCSRK